MEKIAKCELKKIRSELTQEQELALVHPGPSEDTMERIQRNLEYLQIHARKAEEKG